MLISPASAPNNYVHLKNWKIYGSSDKSEWHLLDMRENVSLLNNGSATAHFECNQKKRY